MPGVVETSRTRSISLRVPKDILNVIDALVEAGLFKSRTEFTIAAYLDFLDKITRLALGYYIAKKTIGPPTSENIADFVKEYLNAVTELTMEEVKETPLEHSEYIVLLSMFSSVDRKNPEKLAQVLEKLKEFFGISEIGEKKNQTNSNSDPPMPGVVDPPKTTPRRDPHEGV